MYSIFYYLKKGEEKLAAIKSIRNMKFTTSALALLLILSTVILLSPRMVSAVPETGLYMTTDTLNLREGPSTNYGLVNDTVIPKNCSIIIDEFSADNAWGHTSYNGCTGWVYMAYTQKVSEDDTHVGLSAAQIVAQINSTYSAMRAARGYSYSGWCGQYVKDMLNYIGVGYYGNGSYNGNQWYYTLVTNGVTRFGYKQVKYPGGDSLNRILADNGGVAYNIVLTFNAFYSSSGSYVPYGHVVFINAIIDGVVYFSESFSSRFSGNEGSAQAKTFSQFVNYYYNYFGEPIGAIHMTQGTVLKPVSGTKLENTASNKLLTVEERNESADFDGATISVHGNLGSSERQVFHFEKTNEDGMFTIRPQSSDSRVLTVSSDNSIKLAPKNNSDSQKWYFQILDRVNYKYVIRSKTDPDLVLTASGTSDNAAAVLSKYATGNTRQIWKIPTSQDLSCKVQSMEIVPQSLEIATDTTARLSVKMFPAFASNTSFNWSSEDPSIVSVQGGTIAAKRKGMTIIKATLSDGSLFAVCVVTVKDELTLLGDINKDNVISIRDFNVIARFLNGDTSENEINVENGDVNRDGKIDQKDFDEYVKYFSGDTSCILYKEHGPAQ